MLSSAIPGQVKLVSIAAVSFQVMVCSRANYLKWVCLLQMWHFSVPQGWRVGC